jgi:hypothetical protein
MDEYKKKGTPDSKKIVERLETRQKRPEHSRKNIKDYGMIVPSVNNINKEKKGKYNGQNTNAKE